MSNLLNTAFVFLFVQEYEVLDLLGKGGFAVVYRARCKRTGLEVAIKMVSIHLIHHEVII